jgi:hypothetical protein
MNVDVLKTPGRGAETSGTADLVQSGARRALEPAQEGEKRLWRRVAQECEAMAEYAYSAGLGLPGDVATLVDEALAIFGHEDVQVLGGTSQAIGDRRDSPPASTSGLAETSATALLTKAHAALALIIKPATPEGVLLLIDERRKHSAWYTFGPLPIVRQMLGLAILSLMVLLAVSLSPDINPENLSKTLLEISGLPLLKVEIFLLSAASVGSCFQNLQQINAYISSGTYDPKFQSAYWTRWVMGLISGVVFSQIIYDIFDALSGSHDTAHFMPAIVGQPVLALLGGYSVDVVHGILSRVVDSIGSLFRSPTGPGDASKIETAEAAAARERLKIASEMSELRGSLGGESSSEEILRRFDEIIRRNIPPGM